MITYYLEMNSPDSLNEKAQPEGFSVAEDEVKQHQLNRFLYELVGTQWSWIEKLSLSDEQWQNYAEREQLKTFIAYFNGTIAGYYELEQQKDSNVEIIYFGLAPRFIGQGFGGYLLSHAAKSAWAWQGTKRVWLYIVLLITTVR